MFFLFLSFIQVIRNQTNVINFITRVINLATKIKYFFHVYISHILVKTRWIKLSFIFYIFSSAFSSVTAQKAHWRIIVEAVHWICQSFCFSFPQINNPWNSWHCIVYKATTASPVSFVTKENITDLREGFFFQVPY